MLLFKQDNFKKPNQKVPPMVLVRTVSNFTNALEKLRIKLMPPHVAMLQMVGGYRVSQSIYVAAKLGIADLLKDGPKSSDELAKVTGTHASSLYRLLRALASVGVFAEDENSRFGLTPLAAALQTGVPDSVRASTIMFCEQWHWRLWGDLLESVKTGKTAVDHIYGTSNLFEYFMQDLEAGKVFNEAMTSTSVTANDAVVTGYDFSAFRKLVDVGGGEGSLLASILKAYPTVKGVLFDQASAIEDAQEKQYVEAEELKDRCELVAGDFFVSVPTGDAYILKTVIHNWDDERAVAILNNCRQAMTENGKLLLVELVIPPGNARSFGKFLDIEMLTVCGGCERTASEYSSLLKAAGFNLAQIISTLSPWSVIEAVPV